MSYPENTELIVGLMGKKDHGKTAVAEYFVEHYAFAAAAFADPLKKKLSELLDIPLEEFYPTTPEGKESREREILPEWGKTIRRLMQDYGDGCREIIHKEIWIRAMDKMLRDRFYGPHLVISDVRYINEADYVRSNKGKGFLIRIIDPRKQSDDYHRSETEQGMIKPPYILVVNDGTLEDLFTKIDEALKDIKIIQEGLEGL